MQAMQISPPVSDVSVGLWTPTPIFSRIDEATFNDSDYVSSGADPDVNSFVVGLKPLAWPDPGSQTLQVRFKKTDDGAPVLVELLHKGESIRADYYKATSISSSFSTVALTLTDEEIALITDYNSLSVKITAGGPECCNREMPLKLTATLTNVSGCDDLSGVSIPLIFQGALGGLAGWFGRTDVCGSPFHIYFYCSGTSPNNLYIDTNAWGAFGPPSCISPFSGPLQAGATCDPVNAVFSISPRTIEDTCNCCADNEVSFDIVVTE